MRAGGCGKTRIGAPHDGGYVMLDAIAPSCRAVSLGIGGDDRWDLDLAMRGLPVDQYDHTLPQPLSWHVNLRFWPLRITPHPGAGCAVLADLLASSARDVLLKIDIEGAEWDVLDTTPSAALARCPQICVEFHGLLALDDSRFGRRANRVFRKLAATHAVTHVHGNNCGRIAEVRGATLPDVLEVTFAARRCFEILPTDERFPGPLDAPNDPARPDIDLGRFAF